MEKINKSAEDMKVENGGLSESLSTAWQLASNGFGSMLESAALREKIVSKGSRYIEWIARTNEFLMSRLDYAYEKAGKACQLTREYPIELELTYNYPQTPFLTLSLSDGYLESYEQDGDVFHSGMWEHLYNILQLQECAYSLANGKRRSLMEGKAYYVA